MRCPNCGVEVADGAVVCADQNMLPRPSEECSDSKVVKNDAFAVVAPSRPARERDLAPRPIDYYLYEYVRVGYRVVFRDDRSAQVIRPKTFSRLGSQVALACVLLSVGVSLFAIPVPVLIGLAEVMSGFGLLIFIVSVLAYLMQSEQASYLVIDETGNMKAYPR